MNPLVSAYPADTSPLVAEAGADLNRNESSAMGFHKCVCHIYRHARAATVPAWHRKRSGACTEIYAAEGVAAGAGGLAFSYCDGTVTAVYSPIYRLKSQFTV